MPWRESADVTIDDGVLHVLVTGVFNEACVRSLRERAGRMPGWSAGLVDLTRAAILLPGEGWHALAAGALPRPVALCVAERHLQSAEGYCDLMAARGFLRMAFTCRERARAWALRRARLAGCAPRLPAPSSSGAKRGAAQSA